MQIVSILKNPTVSPSEEEGQPSFLPTLLDWVSQNMGGNSRRPECASVLYKLGLTVVQQKHEVGKDRPLDLTELEHERIQPLASCPPLPAHPLPFSFPHVPQELLCKPSPPQKSGCVPMRLAAPGNQFHLGLQLQKIGLLMVSFICQFDLATGAQIFGYTPFWVCL